MKVTISNFSNILFIISLLISSSYQITVQENSKLSTSAENQSTGPEFTNVHLRRDDHDTCPVEKMIPLNFDEANMYMYTSYKGNMYPAENILKDKVAQTSKAIGRFWKAEFPITLKFGKISILNNKKMDGSELAGTEVFLDEVLCGKIPDSTVNGKWYDVNCNGKSGTIIKLKTTRDVKISFQGIKAWGTKICYKLAAPMHRIPISPFIVSETDPRGGDKGGFSAVNALITSDRCAQPTRQGGVVMPGSWWKATFPEDQEFTKIRIGMCMSYKNKFKSGIGHKLPGIQILVSGQLCATQPSKKSWGKVLTRDTDEKDRYYFDYICKKPHGKPIRGNELKIKSTTGNTSLIFYSVEAYGTLKGPESRTELYYESVKPGVFNYVEKPAKELFPEMKMLNKQVSISSKRSSSYWAPNAINTNENQPIWSQIGVGQWWKFVSEKPRQYRLIAIRNREDDGGNDLAGTKVLIDGKLCGQLPDRTARGQWYDVICNMIGKELKLETTRKVALQISHILVYGKESPPFDPITVAPVAPVVPVAPVAPVVHPIAGPAVNPNSVIHTSIKPSVPTPVAPIVPTPVAPIVPNVPHVNIPAGQFFNLIGPGGFCAESPTISGGTITQQICTASPLMQWEFVPMNGGYVIRNRANKYVFDNTEHRNIDGNDIIANTQHNTKNQIWVPHMLANNILTFKNPETDKCLSGTKIHKIGRMYHLFTCSPTNANKNQWFSIGIPQVQANPITPPVCNETDKQAEAPTVPTYNIPFFTPSAGTIDMELLRN